MIKLERGRELLHELVDAIEELEKDGAALVEVVAATEQSAPVSELVTKLEPLALHQHLQSHKSVVLDYIGKMNKTSPNKNFCSDLRLGKTRHIPIHFLFSKNVKKENRSGDRHLETAEGAVERVDQ